MRLLMDACVWRPAVEHLRAAGHDVDAVHDWPSDPGDEEALRRSVAERRVLVTLDKDFGELVFVLGAPHPGIVRLVGIPAKNHGAVAQRILERFGDELVCGALVVAEPDRVRVRLPSE